jgi:hypothetical protein
MSASTCAKCHRFGPLCDCPPMGAPCDGCKPAAKPEPCPQCRSRKPWNGRECELCGYAREHDVVEPRVAAGREWPEDCPPFTLDPIENDGKTQKERKMKADQETCRRVLAYREIARRWRAVSKLTAALAAAADWAEDKGELAGKTPGEVAEFCRKEAGL